MTTKPSKGSRVCRTGQGKAGRVSKHKDSTTRSCTSVNETKARPCRGSRDVMAKQGGYHSMRADESRFSMGSHDYFSSALYQY